MDVRSYEQSQELMALRQLLAFADREIEAGDTVPIEEVMAEFGVDG